MSIDEAVAFLKQVSKNLYASVGTSASAATSTTTRFNKIMIATGLIGAIGISISINHYFRLISFRRKRSILNKSARLVDAMNIAELRQANVRIKDMTHVNAILSNMMQSGLRHLQVVSDFDRTISTSTFNGKPCATSNSAFENSKFISPDMKQQFKELREKYMPIEHDGRMTREEKLPHMIEWWRKSFTLAANSGIHRDNIGDIVRQSTIRLRDDCKWFFYTLERCDVPLLVFSAGLGDIIAKWLAQECGTFTNMKLVSNFLQFDPTTGIVGGLHGPLIHVFNKNEASARLLLDADYERSISGRTNVLLIGDSLGDVDMASGLPTLNNLLKVGFLNDFHVEPNNNNNNNNTHDTCDANKLTSYMNAFDIVIINDPTFNVPNAILRSLI